jgi:pentatricopeptide repeat protein
MFELMPKYRCTPDIVTFSSLINGFSEQGLDEVAFDLFRSMPCRADIFSYNATLKGLCMAARWDDAGELIADMVTKDCLPNEVTFNILINSLCQKGLVNRAIEVYEQMPKYGITPDIFTYNTLINGYSEQGCLDDALKFLSTMPCEPDTISYNSVLKGLCRAQRWKDAEKLVTEMLRKNCTPNEVTFKYANQLFIK